MVGVQVISCFAALALKSFGDRITITGGAEANRPVISAGGSVDFHLCSGGAKLLRTIVSNPIKPPFRIRMPSAENTRSNI